MNNYTPIAIIATILFANGIVIIILRTLSIIKKNQPALIIAIFSLFLGALIFIIYCIAYKGNVAMITLIN